MEKEEDGEKRIEYKICLLGDSTVGKTAIFRKISFGDFSKTILTVGVDRRTIKYTDVEVNIEGHTEKKSFDISLFDTAGQERFRSITKNYIKGSDGIILVYDICKKSTFDNIDNWLKSIQDILSQWKDLESYYLIMLIGNKLDKAEESPEERKVTAEEGQKKAEQFDIFWGGECSAKAFTEKQLKDVFANLIIDLYKKKGNKSSTIQDNLLEKTESKKNEKKKRKKKFC
jgi:small GTP-binding protein